MKLSIELITKLKPFLEPRVNTLSEVRQWVDFIEGSKYTEENLIEVLPKDQALFILSAFLNRVKNYEFQFIESWARSELSTSHKLGKSLHPVRVALTGKKVSLPLFGCVLNVLGVEEVKKRLTEAIECLTETTNH